MERSKCHEYGDHDCKHGECLPDAVDHGPACPHCFGPAVPVGPIARSMFYRCRDCHRAFFHTLHAQGASI